MLLPCKVKAFKQSPRIKRIKKYPPAEIRVNLQLNAFAPKGMAPRLIRGMSLLPIQGFLGYVGN
jgi:hypothetical protein